MKARALTLALVLASALAPRAARADGSADVAAARELFNEASRHAAAGDWERARADYARSYALKHEPVTRYSLGVAQMKTGHLVDALESFRAFLAEADEAPHAAGYVAPAQKAIAELTPRVSRVRIAVTPPAPGLVVTLDAERVPDLVLDRPRLVDPGAHEIVARADGFAEARQRFTVKEGGQAEVRLTLTPSTVTIAKAPGPRAEPARVDVPPRADAAAKPAGRTLPVALLVGGGAFVVGGVVVGALGMAQAAGLETQHDPGAGAARTKAAIGNVLGGVGLAAAVTGVVLLVTRTPSPPAAHAARALP